MPAFRLDSCPATYDGNLLKIYSKEQQLAKWRGVMEDVGLSGGLLGFRVSW